MEKSSSKTDDSKADTTDDADNNNNNNNNEEEAKKASNAAEKEADSETSDKQKESTKERKGEGQQQIQSELEPEEVLKSSTTTTKSVPHDKDLLEDHHDDADDGDDDDDDYNPGKAEQNKEMDNTNNKSSKKKRNQASEQRAPPGHKKKRDKRRRITLEEGIVVQKLDKKTKKVLAEYDSVSQATAANGLEERPYVVYKCLRGQYKSGAGFRWRYARRGTDVEAWPGSGDTNHHSGDYKRAIKTAKSISTGCIVQRLDKTSGKVLDEYETIHDAAVALDLHYSLIYDAVRGITETAAGFCWEFRQMTPFEMTQAQDRRVVEKHSAAQKLINSTTSTSTPPTTMEQQQQQQMQFLHPNSTAMQQPFFVQNPTTFNDTPQVMPAMQQNIIAQANNNNIHNNGNAGITPDFPPMQMQMPVFNNNNNNLVGGFGNLQTPAQGRQALAMQQSSLNPSQQQLQLQLPLQSPMPGQTNFVAVPAPPPAAAPATPRHQFSVEVAESIEEKIKFIDRIQDSIQNTDEEMNEMFKAKRRKLVKDLMELM